MAVWMLEGEGYWLVVVAMALCVPGAVARFSHVAGGCVSRLVWIVVWEQMVAASRGQFLPAPRLEQGR